MRTEYNSKIKVISLKRTEMTKQVYIKYAIKQGISIYPTNYTQTKITLEKVTYCQ